MSADLHIHVFEGITERDLANFNCNSLGSKWFNPRPAGSRLDDGYSAITHTPHIWIGEVSWLKAALFDDSDTYVPGTVAQISEAIGEDLPPIDDELIAKIRQAFDVSNDTGYSLANVDEVMAFLEAHRGKQVFTVSW